MFDDRQFSRDMKMELAHYLGDEKTNLDLHEKHVSLLRKFDLNFLKNDQQKISFWINVYNGLTNLLIVENKLKKSVWEKPDFFTDRRLQIQDIFFSLDDIEHGLLRRNGKRRNDKPNQFAKGDVRRKFMVDEFDSRIHFALNCGSVSCPPLAFYSVENLDTELDLAMTNFSDQEFLIDHINKEISCSQIFVWYHEDFDQQFLKDRKLSQYRVTERPYKWRIQ